MKWIVFTLLLCVFAMQNIGEVVRSGGGVENGISSAGLYQTYTLLPCRAP